MKFLRRIAFFVAALAVLLIALGLEACNWSTGPRRSIHTSVAGKTIATVTHGFTDRRTYVFDDGKSIFRKLIFAFDASDGPTHWDGTLQGGTSSSDGDRSTSRSTLNHIVRSQIRPGSSASLHSSLPITNQTASTSGLSNPFATVRIERWGGAPCAI